MTPHTRPPHVIKLGCARRLTRGIGGSVKELSGTGRQPDA